MREKREYGWQSVSRPDQSRGKQTRTVRNYNNVVARQCDYQHQDINTYLKYHTVYVYIIRTHHLCICKECPIRKELDGEIILKFMCMPFFMR